MKVFILLGFLANVCFADMILRLSSLVPSIGVPAGNPVCEGSKPSEIDPRILIPCYCPPSQSAVLRQIQSSITNSNSSIPIGIDLESNIRRFEITLIAVQELKCPAVSTRLKGTLDTLTQQRGQPVQEADRVLSELGLTKTLPWRQMNRCPIRQ